LRPFELERAMLFEQYNLSRLADRLARTGLIERRNCADDRRGQMLAITPAGREMRLKMWQVYGPAIEEGVGAKISSEEARSLAEILRKLA
jgi:DNA-binding MarR family transcriptional regulator